MRFNPSQLVIAAAQWLLPAWGLLAGAGAQASLGGDAASVVADAASIGVAALATYYPGYRLEQSAASSGLEIREYLGADGQVFAVAWSGPVQPDLQRLLGTYYPEYASALAALRGPGLRRSLRLSLPGFVVESGGHLRAYTGRAYLPDHLPAGVSLADLQ